MLHARTFPALPGQSIGPGVFPMLLGAGLALCGASLLWSGRKGDGTAWVELEDWVRRPRRALNALLVVGALIFYAQVVETVGFFLTALVFLVVLFLAFGVSRRWVAPLAVAGAGGSSEVRIQPGSKYVMVVFAPAPTALAVAVVVGRLLQARLPFAS